MSETKETIETSPLRARRLLAKVGLAVASMATVLMVMEAAVRILGLVPSASMYNYSESRHYGLKPNVKFESVQGIKNTINSLGLSEREIPLAKSVGEYRVVVLGDSFVQNVNVEVASRFTSVLERELNRPDDGTEFTVINAGISGYNTFQKRVLLEEVGIRYEPDLVVLAYLLNDSFQMSYSNRLYQRLPAPVSRSAMIALNSSYLLRFLRVSFHYWVTEDELELLGGTGELKRKQNFIASLGDMQRMADLCSEIGSEFVVVILPYMRDFVTFEPYYTMVESAVAERGMPVVNFAESFDLFHRNEAALQISDGDAHPSSTANQIIATQLLAFIQSLDTDR